MPGNPRFLFHYKAFYDKNNKNPTRQCSIPICVKLNNYPRAPTKKIHSSDTENQNDTVGKQGKITTRFPIRSFIFKSFCARRIYKDKGVL